MGLGFLYDGNTSGVSAYQSTIRIMVHLESLPHDDVNTYIWADMVEYLCCTHSTE